MLGSDKCLKKVKCYINRDIWNITVLDFKKWTRDERRHIFFL